MDHRTVQHRSVHHRSHGSSRPLAPRRTLRVTTGFPPGRWWEQLQYLLAIGGPIGFIPWVPATWASLVTALLVWALAHRLALATPLSPLGWGVGVVVAATLLTLVDGVACSTAERLLNQQDPRNVVLDEIAGQMLTFAFLAPLSWRAALAGFVLFRIFDVWKPWGVRHAEAAPGGWGIMLDDIVAGVYGALVLVGLHLLMPHLLG